MASHKAAEAIVEAPSGLTTAAVVRSAELPVVHQQTGAMLLRQELHFS